MSAFQNNAVNDGMNAEGLSVGSLRAGGTRYQPFDSAPGCKNVFIGFIVDWLLGQYRNCAEVKAAFKDNLVRVTASIDHPIQNDEKASLEAALPQHLAVHDAAGNSLVIEFINEKAVLTDNPVGVLTNLPVFSWQIANLGLYAHLSNFDTKDVTLGSLKFDGGGNISDPANPGIPGMGNGLAGIPGNYQPASRFVKSTYLKHFALPPTSAKEAVSQAFHLLNNVDIITGVLADRVTDEKTKVETIEYDRTQWIVVKDLTSKILYLRMYESPLPYSITFDSVFKGALAPNPHGRQFAIPTERLAMEMPL